MTTQPRVDVAVNPREADDATPRFSICIPNYNYEKYLGRTVQSVLAQAGESLEIVVSDNASTDGSLDVLRRFDDSRIRVRVNQANVGFAGNLDRAASMARGDRLIMLSSDDLVRPGALATYRALAAALGTAANSAVFTSTEDIIDPDDRVTGILGRETVLWTEKDRAPELDAVAGGPVYAMTGAELLRRSLLTMKNPLNFASACYPRQLYAAVEGYGGGRLINPDKYFHWKLLGVTDKVYWIDHSWFAYRWHPANQTAQQNATGALKYMVDEYASTLELDSGLLARLGLAREQLCEAFVEHDVARHGLATLGRGQRMRAKRILTFGRAVYPDLVNRNRKALALRALLALGPVGQWIAAMAYRRHRPFLGPTD